MKTNYNWKTYNLEGKIIRISIFKRLKWWFNSLFKNYYLEHEQPKIFNEKGEQVRVTGSMYADGESFILEENVKTGKTKKYKKSRSYTTKFGETHES